MTDEEFDELVEIEHKEFLKWLDEQNNLLDKPISEILEEAFFAGFEGGMSKVRLTETTCVNRLHHVEKENKELKAQIERMKCCANCKHRERGDMSDTENCGQCAVMYCDCRKSTLCMDWQDCCLNWEAEE